jgi:uncharacterized protein (TIGR02453 family)
MPFRGFPEEAMSFYRQLKKNNKREWFQPRKSIFEEKVRAPMCEFVDAINAELSKWAPAFVTESRCAIYRIYRDTRFSSDKTPYKTQTGASFYHRALEKHGGAGYYVAISHEGTDVGGGVYMPGPEQLLAIRTLLSERYEEFLAVTTGKKLEALVGKLHGEELSRVPKGFASDHPAADLLRKKQWYFYVTLDAGLAMTPKLVPEVMKRFKAMQPMIEFLNGPLLAQRKKVAARAMAFA